MSAAGHEFRANATANSAEFYPRGQRVALAVFSLLVSLAGPLAVAYPPPSMAETVGPGTAVWWGVYVLAGGLLCLAATIFRAWILEYLGIPLVMSALVFYGGVVLRTTGNVPGRWTGAVLLLAFPALLAARWWIVHQLARHVAGRRGPVRQG
jgi:hypothetical protein